MRDDVNLSDVCVNFKYISAQEALDNLISIFGKKALIEAIETSNVERDCSIEHCDDWATYARSHDH